MIARRLVAVAVATCAGGVAACGAAAPSPSEPRSAVPSAAARVEPTPSFARGTVEPWGSDSATGLAAKLEISVVDPAVTHPVLEFVSAGQSILFSSGVAGDVAADAAPDLWRYVPGSPEAQLVWRNSERDHSIVRIAGDLDAVAFVDVPLDGERAWTLRFIPDGASEPIVLDEHPGDEEVSSLVPSVSVSEGIVVWSAFDRGPSGAVSQILVAQAPGWEPRVVLERLAAEAELWLPSVYAADLVYTEVRYSADRSRDERSVHLLELRPGAEPRRLDVSGRATMPLVWGDDVIWKEADPGFNMFNWGRMFHYDLAMGEVSPLPIWPQEYVNYPSFSGRFAAWWGADSAKFGVYDMETNRAGMIATYSADERAGVLRPHVHGDLLVWLYFEEGAKAHSELRYTILPFPGGSRLED